ncbi:MAG: tetratricopeptide repeat protein [Methylovirgula sp.]
MQTNVPASFVPWSKATQAKTGFRALFARHCSKAALLTASLLLAGCQSFGQNGIAAGVGNSDAAIPSSPQQLASYTTELGQRYDSNPNDKRTALTYAHALRKSTRYAQAVAVLQRLAAAYPKDNEVLGAYGKALVDAGRLDEAADVLPRAHTPENPNWTILSAQGTVADQQGDHAKAQEYYQAALKIVPNQPDVLSNLGLSYALSKQLPLAEQTLELAAQQPSADVRVRQNLALVLALEGKFEQAQNVAQRDLQPLQAAENVAAIRQMVAQSNPWSEIRALDGKPSRKVARRNVTQKVAASVSKPKPVAKEQAANFDPPTTAE